MHLFLLCLAESTHHFLHSWSDQKLSNEWLHDQIKITICHVVAYCTITSESVSPNHLLLKVFGVRTCPTLSRVNIKQDFFRTDLGRAFPKEVYFCIFYTPRWPKTFLLRGAEMGFNRRFVSRVGSDEAIGPGDIWKNILLGDLRCFLSLVLQKLGNYWFNPFRQQFNNTFIDTILDDVPDFIHSCQLQI